MSIAQIIGCFILWLVIVPLCAGILPAFCLEKKPRKLGTTFLMGWVLMTCFFQVIAVPFIIMGYAFSFLCKVYMIGMGMICMVGVIAAILEAGNGEIEKLIEFPHIKKYNRSDLLTWGVFWILVIFQLVMVVIYMTPDGDDSYYIAHSGISVATDTMYRRMPYTGMVAAMDYRHALAPFSMFVAFLAKRSGLHVAIVAHTIWPLMLIPLSYLAYYKIAGELFSHDKSKLSVFMVIMAGLQIFGGASFYTKETFNLTRPWQGKSIFANIIIPIVFYLLVLIVKRTSKSYISKKRMVGLYLMLFMTNLAAAFTTSLGLLFLVIIEGIMFIVISVRNKKIWLFPTGLLTLIPCFIYMCLYLVL